MPTGRMVFTVTALDNTSELLAVLAGRARELGRAYSITATGRRRVALRTGGRGGPSRAEHARILRVARLLRRRERRTGVPAKTYAMGWHFPRAHIE